MLSSLWENVDDLIYSVFLFLAIVFICNITRDILLFGGFLRLEDKHRVLIAEIIGTLETAVICFELNFVIFDAFGVPGYTFFLFLTIFWQSNRPDAYQYDANPLVVLAKHVEGDSQLSVAEGSPHYYSRFEFVAMMIWSEAIGAMMAYYFLMSVAWNHSWSFRNDKSISFHQNRFETADVWQASIAGNAFLAGMAEGFFSFAQFLLPFFIRHRGLQGNLATLATDASKAIFSGCASVYSGGYFNPIMASALEINTHGYPSSTKIGVYWIAPLVGTLLGIVVKRMVYR